MIASIVKNAKGTIDVNFVGIRERLTNALKGQASDEMIKGIVSEIASNSKIVALVSAAQKKKPTASDAKEAMLENIKKLLTQYLGEIRTGVYDSIVAEGTVVELVANFGKILESNGMRAEIAEKSSGIVEAIEKSYNTAKERIAASARTKEPAPTTASAVDRFSFENAYKTTREEFDKLKVKTKEEFETLFSVRIQEFEEMSKTKLTESQKQELLKRAMAQYERDYPSTSM